MKKTNLILCLLALAACSKENIDDEDKDGSDISPDRTVVIYSNQVSISSKVSVNEDGSSFIWEKGDRIGVYMNDGTGLDSDIYTADNVGQETGKALFDGELLFVENGAETSFYAYCCDLPETLPDEPSEVTVSVASEQIQEGRSAGHISEYGILVAEPAKVTAPDDKEEPTPSVNLTFRPALSIIEFMVSSNTPNMVLESIVVAPEDQTKALTVSDATIDLTTPADDPAFASLEGGTAGNSVILRINGNQAIPVSSGEGDNEDAFPAYMTILPGDYSETNLSVTVNVSEAGSFTFTVPGKDMEKGTIYTETLFIEKESSSEDGVWSGGIKEPEMLDHNAKTVGIATGDELAWLAAAVNGDVTDNVPDPTFAGYTVTLTDDIDLGGTVEWTPIGDESGKAFSGKFNGQGHSVSNIKYTAANKGVSGLFGYVEGTDSENMAEISDILIKSIAVAQTITAQDFGGVCADISNARITGCSVESANIEYKSTSDVYYGGICGRTDGIPVISDCFFSGSIKVESNAANRIGGIVAYINGTPGVPARITDCTVDAELQCPTSTSIIAGICAVANLSIDWCRFSGSVTGGNDAAGIAGLIGTSSVVITGCVNEGNISGARAGGIAAQVNKNDRKVTVIASYNTGSVTSTVAADGTVNNSYAAGILAWHRGTGVGSLSACYNTGTISGVGTTGAIYGNKNKAVVSKCYIKEKGTADASDPEVILFSSDNWPADTDTDWGLAASETEAREGKYWKSLGSYSGEYPLLWWE